MVAITRIATDTQRAVRQVLILPKESIPYSPV